MVYKGSQVRRRVVDPSERPRPDMQVVNGMSSPERHHILVLLGERIASVAEIAEELDLSPDKVRYELGVLKHLDPPVVEIAAKKKVRGVYEYFYRAAKRPYLDPSEWRGVPDVLKGGLRSTLLQMLLDDVFAALSEDTYDSLEGAHMSWTTLLLDERGWQEITDLLFQAVERVLKIKVESAERLLKSDLPGVSCTVSILGYPSANEDRKVGPPFDADEATTSVEVPKSTGSRKKTTKARGKKTMKGRAGKAKAKAGPKSKRKDASK